MILVCWFGHALQEGLSKEHLNDICIKVRKTKCVHGKWALLALCGRYLQPVRTSNKSSTPVFTAPTWNLGFSCNAKCSFNAR